MNPGGQLVDPKVSNATFKRWEEVMKDNKDMKENKKARIMPLLEFDLTNKNRVYTQDLD